MSGKEQRRKRRKKKIARFLNFLIASLSYVYGKWRKEIESNTKICYMATMKAKNIKRVDLICKIILGLTLLWVIFEILW